MQPPHKNNILLSQKQIDNKIIYMLSFSHLIDNYWKNNERSFNGLINQEGAMLDKKIESIQTKREIFQNLDLKEIKLVIRDLYARRSIFIHFVNKDIDYENNELAKVYYKIIKFQIDKSKFNRKKINLFIDKYINVLSALIFLYWNEKDVFFQSTTNSYENMLMKVFSMRPKNRYSETNFEAVNWYNHYFFNKKKNLSSGTRYESFLLNYVNILNEMIQYQSTYFFKTYIIHEKVKIINEKKYKIKKRHKNNSVVLMFDKDKKPSEISANFAFIDYKVFLVIKFMKIFNNLNVNYEREILRKIVKRTLKELKTRKKINNYFSFFDYINILFSKNDISKLKSVSQFTQKWFNDSKNASYFKFMKSKFLYALLYIKLNSKETFSAFLKKYNNVKIGEFFLYYFVVNEKKGNIMTCSKIWESFLEDQKNENLDEKFLNVKIVRKININKNKHIYLAGTTKDFFKFYELIYNKRHILRIAKSSKVKNNKEYPIKYVWNEIERIILIKLLNKDDNLYIVKKYEEVKEENKFIINALFHNYRNYIAHLGNGNEAFFLSYKDYVKKKWSVKEIIRNSDYFKN